MSEGTRHGLRVVSALMDAHELEGSVHIAPEYRHGTVAECEVAMFGGQPPVELAKWLRAVSGPQPDLTLGIVSLTREDAGRGNSIFLRTQVVKDQVLYQISWFTHVEPHWNAPELFLGHALMDAVGFQRVNTGRRLSAEEVQKFLVWADAHAREVAHA